MHVSDAPLTALEKQLIHLKVDVYIQPMGDEFQSEYTPDSARRLPYLTGFDGSAGLGVFFARPSASQPHLLFTDGRYTIQAAQQLGPRVKARNSGESPLSALLAELQDVSIGFDPWLITRAQLIKWLQLTEGNNVQWVPIENPVDVIWKDQPASPSGEVVLHPPEFAGQSYANKRDAFLKLLKETGANGLILTLPDGINWLLNIRGSDVAYNPLLLSYFILDAQGQGTLFTHEHAFSNSVDKYFAAQDILLRDIAEIFQGKLAFSPKCTFIIDPETSAQGWWQWAESQKLQLLEVEDPTLLPKACKNAAELDGMRAAHIRDGLALSKFLCWLDAQVEAKQLPTELDIVAKLESFRAVAPEYRGPSFATISGSGPNGAIVHYRVDETSNRQLQMGEIFLLDSGGQYIDGTTDVTRTIAIGMPSTAIREHNTRVLKGHIALASARFPLGTTGQQLDALARQHLWAAGLDYDHGTGHGVGAHLSVHEGPQRISKRGSAVPLQVGMIISNEPGYYETGSHGIRIENLVTVVSASPGFMAFETLTLAPIDTRLIELSLLTEDERNWLNSYHRRVYEVHQPNMHSTELKWLEKVTKAI